MGNICDGDADDVAARIARIGVGHRVDGVVVILGVGRIDGDERYLAPVLARRRVSALRYRPRGFRFGKRGRGEGLRNAVRVDGNQADRAFAFERAEALDDSAGRQAKPAVARHLDSNEIAVHGGCRCARRNRKFAAKLLLVDRNQAAAAIWKSAENAEHAVLGTVNDLDDASVCFFAGSLNANEGTIAHAGCFAGFGAARRRDVDDWRLTMSLFVPFGRPRQKFAVAVTSGDVSKHHGRKGTGMMQPFASAVDVTFVGQLSQQTIEGRPVCVLGAERAGDLAHSYLAGPLSDEGQELL